MNLNFILSGFKTFYLSFKKNQSDELIEKSKKRKNKIILMGIHGSVLNYYNSFLPMQKFFEQKKIKFIPLDFDYKSDPQTICKSLSTEIKKYSSDKKIFLIAHSYGGLLARNTVTRYLKDSLKYVIITVATPNDGVEIKHKNILDKLVYRYLGLMQPELKNSKMLGYLTKNPLKKCKIVNIVGGKDSLVYEEAATINGKIPDIVLANEDHLSIIYSKSLFYVINGLIKNIK